MANRPFMIQYDIPEVPVAGYTAGTNPNLSAFDNALLGQVNARTRPAMENPSDELWQAGCVRITYSVWLVMESDLNSRAMLILNRMTANNVRWYAVPFADEATQELRTMALENIRREINGYLTRARQTRLEAEERLADESDNNYRLRRQRFLNAARSLELRVIEMIARVTPAAAGFGITAHDLRIQEAVTDVELMGANMKARAAAFARTHGILTRMGKTQEARSLRSGAMPAPIAADYLRDIGGAEADEIAEEIHDSFGFMS